MAFGIKINKSKIKTTKHKKERYKTKEKATLIIAKKSILTSNS